MMSNSIERVMGTLKEIIHFCQEMHSLLKNDGVFFTKNQLGSIEENNKKKMEVITRLSASLNALNEAFPQGIKAYIKQQNASVQNELRQLLEALNQEIVHCHHYIVVNNSIIYANLQMLKEVWDGLKALKSDDSSVTYDETGSIVATTA